MSEMPITTSQSCFVQQKRPTNQKYLVYLIYDRDKKEILDDGI